MQLDDSDILTREVLNWQGVHLFHAFPSSCSQKVRIFLNLKDIDWQSHPLDIIAGENITEYYLGINPRGLVPTLVHDGAVHIESNDILVHLESCFPDPVLIPSQHRGEVAGLLRHEDDLHLALRTVTFFYLTSPDTPPKSQADLDRYATLGSGTVGGVTDDKRDQEITFWQSVVDQGIPQAAAQEAVRTFHQELSRLEKQLQDQPYLLGSQLSVLDIAWLVYVNRLCLAGYPLAQLHPNLLAWFDQLAQRPEITPELVTPEPMLELIASRQQVLAENGHTISDFLLQ